MNKDEQLARLLRLKRHEKPSEDYFEGFLDDFHAHQRKAIATQSAASLWWERVCTACSVLRRPSTAWAAVGAYAAVMLLIHAWPTPDHAARTTVVISDTSAAAKAAPPGNFGPAFPGPGPTSQAPSWQTAIPAGQTMQVSDGPGLAPPVPGKRRTPDQPQDLPGVIGPAAYPAAPNSPTPPPATAPNPTPAPGPSGTSFPAPQP
ncbi:MAG: hypothetical protein JWL81_1278 [Verrucomicrobiales bacterium]|nr:hypothetical protein [Verrucomicrobiales bacterium]